MKLAWLMALGVAACGGGTTQPAGPGTGKQEAKGTPEGETEPEVKQVSEPEEEEEPEASYIQGKFVWFELTAADPAKVAKFYGDLFGWTIKAGDMGGTPIHTIENKGTEIGLILGKSPTPKQWLVYISVPDVDESALDAKANGGKIVVPATDVPPVGVRFAVLADPDGVLFGVARRESGDPPDRQPRVGDWYWSQLLSTNPEDRYSFYSAVAGYTRNQLAEGKTAYVRLVGEELCRGVITKADKGIRPIWVPWVIVDSVDDSVAKAKKLGGKVLKAAWDISDVGRIALLKDPSGASFGVVTLVQTEEKPEVKGDEAEDEEG